MDIDKDVQAAAPPPHGAARPAHANFMALGSGEIAARAIAFVGTAVLARRVGVEGFGILGFAAALASYFSLVVSSGLGEVGSREIARGPQEAGRIAAGAFGVRLLIASAAALLLVAIALVLPKPPLVRWVVGLSAVTVLTAALDSSWAYRGLERGAHVAVGQILIQVVYVGGILLLVSQPADVVLVPLLQAAGELIVVMLLTVPLVWGASFRGWFSAGLRTLRGGATATVNRLLRSVIVTADLILLSFLATDAAVGLYAGAYRICFLVTAIAASAHLAYLPRIVRAAANRPQGSRVLTDAAHLAWVAILPFVAGGIALAPRVLDMLFGSEFVGGATALRLLLLGIAALSIQGAFRIGFLALDRLSVESRILGAAAALNVLLNVWAIPRWGIEGAAAATLVSEVIVLVGVMQFLRTAGMMPSFRPLMAPTVMAALMGAAVWQLSTRTALPIALLLCAGAAIYVLLLMSCGYPAKLRSAWQPS